MVGYETDKAGFDLLAFVEKNMIQDGSIHFDAQSFRDALPRLEDDQLNHLAKYLLHHELVAYAAAPREPGTINNLWQITVAGKRDFKIFSRKRSHIIRFFGSITSNDYA